MISMDKKYIFRGQAMEILTISRPNENYPVAAMNVDTGCLSTFTNDGFKATARNSSQLIEVKPTRWINVYPSGQPHGPYDTKKIADGRAYRDRIACIEFKEGDGICDWVEDCLGDKI